MTEHACICNKRRYLTRKAAKHAAHSLTMGTRMGAYRCPHLDGVWHYGHRPRNVANGTYAKEDWLAKVGVR